MPLSARIQSLNIFVLVVVHIDDLPSHDTFKPRYRKEWHFYVQTQDLDVQKVCLSDLSNRQSVSTWLNVETRQKWRRVPTWRQSVLKNAIYKFTHLFLTFSRWRWMCKAIVWPSKVLQVRDGVYVKKSGSGHGELWLDSIRTFKHVFLTFRQRFQPWEAIAWMLKVLLECLRCCRYAMVCCHFCKQ